MKNKKTIGLIFLILVIAIGGIVFYFYNTNNSKEIELETSDALVQKLYESIVVETTSRGGYDYHIGLTSILYATDMSSELKNYYGYGNLGTKYIKSEICSNYPNQKNSLGTIETYYCGEVDADFMKEISTKVFLGEYLKISVESIFGDNSYVPATFKADLCGTSKYFYDKDTSTYVLASLEGGCTGPLPEYSLVSATKTTDSIILIEKSKEFDSESTQYIDNVNQYKIVFKLDDNSNYILYTIEKITE